MKNKKKKSNIPLILGVIIIVIIICFIIFYTSYMKGVEESFSNVKDTVKSSTILEQTYGKIKEVKFNNFMKWTTKENDYECVEMIIVTDKVKKDLCAKVEYDEALNTYLVNGYIIDGNILND